MEEEPKNDVCKCGFTTTKRHCCDNIFQMTVNLSQNCRPRRGKNLVRKMVGKESASLKQLNHKSIQQLNSYYE